MSRERPSSVMIFFLHRFLFFSLNGFVMINMVLAQSNDTVVQVDVGVVLDMDTLVGKMGLSGLSMALSDFYYSHDHYKTRVVLHTRDSNKDIVGAASAALDLIKNGEVEAIIGPEFSIQTDFVIELGEKARVPIISFSATSPSLSPIRNPYFFRATQNDFSQVEAISSIVKYFGWREAVPVYVDNEFGEGMVPFLTDALGNIDVHVPYRSIISPIATDDQIAEELYKLVTMQTRVFIVHMLPSLSSRLFAKAEEIGMMEKGYVWIVTDGVGNLLNSLNSSVLDSMQGVLAVKTYLPNSKLLENFEVRWKRKFLQDYPDDLNVQLDIFGLRAYDAAFALAMAIEKVAKEDGSFGIQRGNVVNLTDLESIGVSLFGPGLVEALSSVSFRGLAGEFYFINGQLHISTMEVINIVGRGGRGIGFWTPENGLSMRLNVTSKANDPKQRLGIVIWPGESVEIPKGWEVPTVGKKLKIGVPVRESYQEFVKVVRDPKTNATMSVEGYCIDVFDAVMKAMPYNVPYEYIPFALPDGSPAGTYDDLIYQVYLQKYDAVVGDTTIIANRSLYIDFTLPYTESGLIMIVPIKDLKRRNAWVFLKPLTLELWLTSSFFFVLVGFVTWILEHRINEDFRGSPSNQVGTIFWFSFSTMVFAHKEKVVSNLARFVLIVWFFVVLVLTQSYTASLTSMLTVQQLQPTITDVKELIRKGYHVGYKNGSFIYERLKQMKFDENNLWAYNFPEECEEAFDNGGIAAAFGEIPYMKLFLATRCTKFTMVGPSYKTDGFGFVSPSVSGKFFPPNIFLVNGKFATQVFPRNSPLVSDVSRAVLNVTQGDKMTAIENFYFRSQRTCPDSSTTITSDSIGLDSFWGLFLLAGLAAASAFFIYTATFLYKHRNVMIQFDTKPSMWKKMVTMSRQFDQEDLSSPTCRKAQERDQSVTNIEESSNNNFADHRTSYSDTEVSLHFQ